MAAELRVPSGLPGKRGVTLTVLGCGTLGVAILTGILSSVAEASNLSSPVDPDSGIATPNTELSDSNIPDTFIACVRRPESAKRIQRAVQDYKPSVTVLQNENIKGVQAADIVILGCKPYMVADILKEEGMKEALAGKLLISICGGVQVEQMGRALYGHGYPANAPENACRLVRAMPNTAAAVRESMTVIATTTPPLPSDLSAVVDWLFTRIGRVVYLPPNMMDVSTALCGSGPGLLALVMESLADGAVAMGLPRAEAHLMAAQAMRGVAGMVLAGEHPALVRENVSTPGGCTIGGLLVLEEGRVRGTIARSIREATGIAAALAKGVSNVNGTRFDRQ